MISTFLLSFTVVVIVFSIFNGDLLRFLKEFSNLIADHRIKVAKAKIELEREKIKLLNESNNAINQVLQRKD